MPNSKLILSTLLISISPVEFCLPLSARPSRGYDRIDTTFRLQVPTVSSGGGKGKARVWLQREASAKRRPATTGKGAGETPALQKRRRAAALQRKMPPLRAALRK